MKTASKIALGISVASGALLAAWLLTGNRKQMTKEFISKKATAWKSTVKEERKTPFDDSDAHYV